MKIQKKYNNRLLFTMAALFFASRLSNAQDQNLAIYKTAKSTQLSNNKGDAIVEITSNFLGKPYKAGTLEINTDEKLVVNLNELDCSTLVEQSMAIANSENFESFKKELSQLRYKNGKIKGYGSRIHYLTDWLITNQQNKRIKLITKQLGGVLFKKNINFMSTHWDKYPKANTEDIKKEILRAEDSISKNELYYIPKNKIAEVEHLIQNGDIIAITTSIPGLDCSHQGFAIVKNGHLHLLHASSSKKQVIISDENLINYLKKNALQTGIIVARIL